MIWVLVETVYKDRNNAVVVNVFQDFTALSLTAVTRMILYIYDDHDVLQVTVDSADSPVLISWSSNAITFDLRTVSLLGRYYAKVVAIDSQHPQGQTLIHPKAPVSRGRLAFDFVKG